MEQNALRKWPREQLGLLAAMSGGWRDEKVRQALASYVDELVIEPETKTGYLVLNARASGLFAEDLAQKPNDPPCGGSRFNEVEGERWCDDVLFRDPETRHADAALRPGEAFVPVTPLARTCDRSPPEVPRRGRVAMLTPLV